MHFTLSVKCFVFFIFPSRRQYLVRVIRLKPLNEFNLNRLTYEQQCICMIIINFYANKKIIALIMAGF